MEDIVFLLGAGASKDAGYPLMAELSADFERHLKKEGSPAQNDLYSAIQRRLRMPEGGVNIERIIQFCEHLSVFKEEPHASAVHGWRRPFGATQEVVASLVSEMRGYIKSELSEGDLGDPFYLMRLLSVTDRRPVDIFSLNYDRLVETICARQNVRFTTGFSEVWDPKLFDDEEWDVRLFKLHGSVDWYRVTPSGPIYRGGPEHFAFSKSTTQDTLIYPSLGKSTHADPYATLLQRFSDRLMEADLLVVIGYSFQDDHIRRLVTDRMTVNRSLQVLVVDPNAREVLRASGDESPGLEYFAHRVSGLWTGARDALDNHRVRHRLTQIDLIDLDFRKIHDDINQRSYSKAADGLVTTLERGRTQHFHLKSWRVLQFRGQEFRGALRARIAGMAKGAAHELRDGVGQDLRKQFHPAQRGRVGPPVVSGIMAWTLAAAFRFEELLERTEAVVRLCVTLGLEGLPNVTEEGDLARWRTRRNLQGLVSEQQTLLMGAATSLKNAPVYERLIWDDAEAQQRLQILNRELPRLWELWEAIANGDREAILHGGTRTVIYRELGSPEAMAAHVKDSVGALMREWAKPLEPFS